MGLGPCFFIRKMTRVEAWCMVRFPLFRLIQREFLTPRLFESCLCGDHGGQQVRLRSKRPIWFGSEDPSASGGAPGSTHPTICLMGKRDKVPDVPWSTCSSAILRILFFRQSREEMGGLTERRVKGESIHNNQPLENRHSKVKGLRQEASQEFKIH